MVFNTGAALLDAIVLSIVSAKPEGTYGYRITQEVRSVLEVSESTLYPVLRRLQKDHCLTVYDQEHGGRNRRYYQVTEQGMAQLNMYRGEWQSYAAKITGILMHPGDGTDCRPGQDMDTGKTGLCRPVQGEVKTEETGLHGAKRKAAGEADLHCMQREAAGLSRPGRERPAAGEQTEENQMSRACRLRQRSQREGCYE